MNSRNPGTTGRTLPPEKFRKDTLDEVLEILEKKTPGEIPVEAPGQSSIGLNYSKVANFYAKKKYSDFLTIPLFTN